MPRRGRNWGKIIADLQQGSRVLLMAGFDNELVGSIQLELAMRPNALHRAALQKLMVDTTAR